MSNLRRNSVVMSAAAAFLIEKLTKIDPATEQKLKSGVMEVIDTEIYYRGKVGALAAGENLEVDLIKATQQMVAGVTNIDKGQLAEGQYFALDAMTVKHSALSGNVEIQRFTNNLKQFPLFDSDNTAPSQPADNIPVLLQNSEFQLKCGPALIFNRLASSFFIDGTQNQAVDQLNGAVVFETPKLLYPKQKLSFIIKVPPTGTSTSADTCIEIKMNGAVLIQKSQA